jgi:hypothetical protein
MFDSLKFWKRPEEPNLSDEVLAQSKKLNKEIIDRRLKLIADKHLINACKEQLSYLSTCLKDVEMES